MIDAIAASIESFSVVRSSAMLSSSFASAAAGAAGISGVPTAAGFEGLDTGTIGVGAGAVEEVGVITDTPSV